MQRGLRFLERLCESGPLQIDLRSSSSHPREGGWLRPRAGVCPSSVLPHPISFRISRIIHRAQFLSVFHGHTLYGWRTGWCSPERVLTPDTCERDLLGNRVCRCNRVTTRSCWITGGLEHDWCPYKGEIWTQTLTGGMKSREGRGRKQSNVSTDQGISRIAGNYQKLEWTRKNDSLGPVEGAR